MDQYFSGIVYRMIAVGSSYGYLVEQILTVNTVVSRYYGTAGIRKKYNIQTIEISNINFKCFVQ